MATPETPDPGAEPSWLDSLLEMRTQRVNAIKTLQDRHGSTIFVFWNVDQLKQEDFFTLADALEGENPKNDVELIVLSPGGSGEAGYRIGHTFQNWAKDNARKFRVIVPLYAKSAATIIALGAHEIVMGLQSEIGPIDPQIPKYDRNRDRWRYIPAMSIMDGLKLVSEYLDKIPPMSKFFEEIIRGERLSLDDLGVLERSRESGKQYGETLLTGGMIPDQESARQTVERLADYYKFHGHPIDAFEAENELKLVISKSEPDLWTLVKSLRDEYQKFVGQPNIIPGAIVTSVVETATFRSWRYLPTEGRRAQVAYSERNEIEVWDAVR
jgi:Serine dehydrogenase proteinase